MTHFQGMGTTLNLDRVAPFLRNPSWELTVTVKSQIRWYRGSSKKGEGLSSRSTQWTKGTEK
jgi:hypothetical protein